MPNFFKKALFLMSALALVGTSLAPAWTQGKGDIVVFEANWCASCRDVLPIAQEIASQNGLGLVQIDIDSQQAPRQARNLGISVPSDEPPQVFYVNRGRVALLFNGRGYRAGAAAAARSTILQNLQRSQ